MSNQVSDHYNSEYFAWQKSVGEFGGWANRTKFDKFISKDDTVLDFGCGGGYLLKAINCKRKLGVEVNPSAAQVAAENGIEVFTSIDAVPDETLDVAISNHALEHTLQPLDELKMLFRKIKRGGTIVFVVPCESISLSYKPNDVNHHLYSWSPMSLGNLFTEAGFKVSESRAYIHKWPPGYRMIARVAGRTLFDFACRIYGRLKRQWFQVRVIGYKP